MWGYDVCLFHIMFPELNGFSGNLALKVYVKIRVCREFNFESCMSNRTPSSHKAQINFWITLKIAHITLSLLHTHTHTVVICYKIYSLFRCTAFISCVQFCGIKFVYALNRNIFKSILTPILLYLWSNYTHLYIMRTLPHKCSKCNNTFALLLGAEIEVGNIWLWKQRQTAWLNIKSSTATSEVRWDTDCRIIASEYSTTT